LGVVLTLMSPSLSGRASAKEPILLMVGPPDPTSIPSGYRFHSRCPLCKSVDPLAARCRTQNLATLPSGVPSGVASHAVGTAASEAAEPVRTGP